MITGKARLAGVLGWPVTHSISPVLHNHWMARHDIDGAYLPLSVRPTDLKLAVDGLRRAGFLGFNVTIPHKSAMIELIDEVDDDARRMGSVNTVLVQPDGSTKGYSTDGLGFTRNLAEQTSGWSPTGKRVLLLGAGGAARAIGYALIKAGAEEMRISNRRRQRAEELVSQWQPLLPQTQTMNWEDRSAAVAEADLIVNTTSLGMVGQPRLEIDLSAARSDAIIADIVYSPLETDLLGQARERGLARVDGLGMLLHQAVPGFRHWGGVEPSIDEGVRRVALNAISS